MPQQGWLGGLPVGFVSHVTPPWSRIDTSKVRIWGQGAVARAGAGVGAGRLLYSFCNLHPQQQQPREK